MTKALVLLLTETVLGSPSAAAPHVTYFHLHGAVVAVLPGYGCYLMGGRLLCQLLTGAGGGRGKNGREEVSIASYDEVKGRIEVVSGYLCLLPSSSGAEPENARGIKKAGGFLVDNY